MDIVISIFSITLSVILFLVALVLLFNFSYFLSRLTDLFFNRFRKD